MKTPTHIVFGFLLLSLGSVYGADTDSRVAVITHLADWKQSHEEEKKMLEALIPQVEEIGKSFAEINSLYGVENKKKDVSELLDKAFTDWPGLVLVLIESLPIENSIFGGDKLISGPLKIKAAVESALAKLELHSPNRCIETSKSSAKFVSSADCQVIINRCVQSGFETTNDGLALRELSSDLSVVDHAVPDFNEAVKASADIEKSSGPTRVWYENLFNACATIASSGEVFQSTAMARFPKTPAWTNSIYGVYGVDRFRRECVQNMASLEERGRLDELLWSNPDAFPFKYWKTQLDKRVAVCEKEAQRLCRYTYAIKGTRILTYYTMGCEKRDVTKTDITNDMNMMATEAQRLMHSTLIDTIGVCDEAESAGLNFFYEEPSLPDSCKKKAPAASSETSKPHKKTTPKPR